MNSSRASFLEDDWSSGGPSVDFVYEGGVLVSAVNYPVAEEESTISGDVIFLLDEGSALGVSYPLSNLIPTRDGLRKYKVQSGDTLSTIAASFGVNIETLRLANSNLRTTIRPGEELVVLPVSGVLYETKDGDSLESVASRFNISPENIKKYNPNHQKLFEKPNNQVILPYAKPLGSADYVNRYVQGLPDLKTYFALPARGWNWGQLHDYNAVDIADQCGRPIYASAEGLVVEEASDGYWSRGYGNYILIEHPNGTKTRYAHTAKNIVRLGDYVSQGDQIALIGNTGNTHGPTGCHLHFEVYGAKNPFAIK